MFSSGKQMLNSCVRSSRILDEFHFLHSSNSSQLFNNFSKQVIKAKQNQSLRIYQLRTRLKQFQTQNVNSMEELQLNQEIIVERNKQMKEVKKIQTEFKEYLMLTVEEARKRLQVIIS
ncbi:Hypothetical_protein [Hexamita inflata]|uniref:Hypothetical_protein n=1 Tax=Hexamita inflata TaxID=28002 RepID=A0ABP1GZB2_9EUKA